MSRNGSTAFAVAAYNHKDFKAADRLNKLRLYLIEPGKFELDNEDYNFYMKLEEAFHLMRDELSRQVAVNKITVAMQIQRVEAIKLYEGAVELFGKVVDNNNALRRAAMVERLGIMADKCFAKAVYTVKQKVYNDQGDETGEEEVEICDEKWMEMGRRLMADMAKIEGWTEHRPDKKGIDPESVKIPPIVITSDPEAFARWRQKQNMKDE